MFEPWRRLAFQVVSNLLRAEHRRQCGGNTYEAARALIEALYQETHRFLGYFVHDTMVKPNSTPHHNMCLIDLAI